MIDYEKSRGLMIPTGKTEAFNIEISKQELKNAYNLYMR